MELIKIKNIGYEKQLSIIKTIIYSIPLDCCFTICRCRSARRDFKFSSIRPDWGYGCYLSPTSFILKNGLYNTSLKNSIQENIFWYASEKQLRGYSFCQETSVLDTPLTRFLRTFLSVRYPARSFSLSVSAKI